MKSIDFIKSRRDTWISLENETKLLSGHIKKSKSESLLISFINHYRRTVADFSLAQSLFPKTQLVSELNHLIINAMMLISSKQKTDSVRIKSFCTERFPLLVIGLYKFFFISCAIFIISALAGYSLTMVNPFTANAIAGDEYIYKTLDNIENGNPFAIYESRFKYAMSSFIMANNIKVSFLAFASGALYGLGTVFILLSNGLMLGSITAVFAQHGLLFDFITTVLIHGTLELFAIMVAGAAGLRFGQALFRPGELKRTDALYIFGKEAFELCCIMIPLFVIAGVLEGFVTNLHLSPGERIMIIVASIVLLVIYLIGPAFFYILRRREKPVVIAPLVRVKLS